MKIPQKFKEVQASVFQDKTVEHHLPVSVTGSLGSVTVKPSEKSEGEYKVNFHIVESELKAEKWGLKINADAAVTSSVPLPVKIGDYIRYNGVYYRIKGIQPFDSHTLYLCVMWDEY